MERTAKPSSEGIVSIPFPGAMGAEVSGIDLSEPMNGKKFMAWLAAFETYHLLVFRDQSFSNSQFIEFSGWFGDLEENPDPKDWGAPDEPRILRVSNVFRDTDQIKPVDDVGHKSFTLGTSTWHSDSSFRRVPSKASLLYALEIPRSGSQTKFTDVAAAHDALPDDKKNEIDGLVVIHDFEQTRLKFKLPPRPDSVRNSVPPVRQPLVRPIPGGGKALLIGMHASQVVDMDETEGRALLDWLMEWATQDRFVYTHEWRAGDLVMWDNRSTMHRAMPYAIETERRVLIRTTIAGDGALL
jgi:alpha-ketoglutarate-dependent taurine dioxygenase